MPNSFSEDFVDLNMKVSKRILVHKRGSTLQTIACLSRKGSVGKSTLARLVAVSFALSKIPQRATLVDRFEERETPAAPKLDMPSDWSSKNFVDMNTKVSKRIRDKVWKEAALREISVKRLILEALITHFATHGSLAEQFYPEYRGIEQDEISRGR